MERPHKGGGLLPSLAHVTLHHCSETAILTVLGTFPAPQEENVAYAEVFRIYLRRLLGRRLS